MAESKDDELRSHARKVFWNMTKDSAQRIFDEAPKIWKGKDARFYREEKAATLSQSVVDVLSLVAYLQPVTKKQIEAKRHKPSGSLLNQLIRRKLLEIERKKIDGKSQTLYRTTDRFLDLFGLDSLEELPKSQAFESPGY